jgi:NADH:ubiquinone oxidoreductase subunit 6 (subunit J)
MVGSIISATLLAMVVIPMVFLFWQSIRVNRENRRQLNVPATTQISSATRRILKKYMKKQLLSAVLLAALLGVSNIALAAESHDRSAVAHAKAKPSSMPRTWMRA